MPIQEALVWEPSQLERPAGVLFDPPCATKDDDAAQWGALLRDMLRCMEMGDYIMALIQTRNTRSWNDRARQYDFKPSEDYLVAAYRVSAEIGTPYSPGRVGRQWLDAVHAQQVGKFVEPDPYSIQLFQCSAKGCNLTTVGVMKLITFHTGKGMAYAQAFTTAKDAIADGLKFGWRGGSFPPIGSIGRARSGAFIGRA